MASLVTRMNKADFPTDSNGNYTKAAFLAEWESNHIFRQRAMNNGFSVVQGSVIFPDGRVAGAHVK